MAHFFATRMAEPWTEHTQLTGDRGVAPLLYVPGARTALDVCQGTQNRDFMDNWTVHVTISSPGESQGTPGTALGLASWM